MFRSLRIWWHSQSIKNAQRMLLKASRKEIPALLRGINNSRMVLAKLQESRDA